METLWKPCGHFVETLWKHNTMYYYTMNNKLCDCVYGLGSVFVDNLIKSHNALLPSESSIMMHYSMKNKWKLFKICLMFKTCPQNIKCIIA